MLLKLRERLVGRRLARGFADIATNILKRGGWGDWHVAAHNPHNLTLESGYGYEAVGFREFRGEAPGPQCAMLTGVAAGMMELVYGEGTIEERYGTFASREDRCVACGEPSCCFTVTRVE